MPRILVVDDDDIILTAVRRALSRVPEIEVVSATSGPEALEKLASSSFDLIISDFSMPLMHGGQLFAEVQTQHPAMASRFVFHTSDHEVAKTFGPRVVSKCAFIELRGIIADITV